MDSGGVMLALTNIPGDVDARRPEYLCARASPGLAVEFAAFRIGPPTATKRVDQHPGTDSQRGEATAQFPNFQFFVFF